MCDALERLVYWCECRLRSLVPYVATRGVEATTSVCLYFKYPNGARSSGTVGPAI